MRAACGAELAALAEDGPSRGALPAVRECLIAKVSNVRSHQGFDLIVSDSTLCVVDKDKAVGATLLPEAQPVGYAGRRSRSKEVTADAW